MFVHLKSFFLAATLGEHVPSSCAGLEASYIAEDNDEVPCQRISPVSDTSGVTEGVGPPGDFRPHAIRQIN
ncbi:hypothetical protein EYF80_059442 [Liparis tanakae]|uniref:Secreted protein n=1 Tax=Liparis tanakae TaxID=230148 RepID=A0A4Z2END6_9TELE|nr:hypothetical protein EYF80_059442 [Liparis tanakae]